MRRLLLVITVFIATFSLHARGETVKHISFEDLKDLIPSTNVDNRLVNFFSSDFQELPLDGLPYLEANDVGTLNIKWTDHALTISVNSRNRAQGRSISINNEMKDPTSLQSLFLYEYQDGTKLINFYERGSPYELNTHEPTARIFLKKGGIFLSVVEEDSKMNFAFAATTGEHKYSRRLIGCAQALSI